MCFEHGYYLLRWWMLLSLFGHFCYLVVCRLLLLQWWVSRRLPMQTCAVSLVLTDKPILRCCLRRLLHLLNTNGHVNCHKLFNHLIFIRLH